MTPLPLGLGTLALIVIALVMGAFKLTDVVRRDDNIGDPDHG